MASLVPKKHLLSSIKKRNWIIAASILGILLLNLIIWVSVYIPLKDLQKRAKGQREEFDKYKREIQHLQEEQRHFHRSILDFHMKITNERSSEEQTQNSNNYLVPQRLNKLDQLIGLLEQKVTSSDVVLRRQQEGMERLYEMSQNYRKDIVTELIELKSFRQEYQKELQQLKEQNVEAWTELDSLRKINSTIQELRAGNSERALLENRCNGGLNNLGRLDNDTSVLGKKSGDVSGGPNKEDLTFEVGPKKYIQQGVKEAKKYFASVVSFVGGKLGLKKSLGEESSEESISIEIPQEDEIEIKMEDIEVSLNLASNEDEKQEKKAEPRKDFVSKLRQLVGVSENVQRGGELLPEKMLTFFAYLEAKFEDINTLLEQNPMTLETDDSLSSLMKEYEALQQSYFSTKRNFAEHHGFAQKPNKLNKQWKKFFLRIGELETSLNGFL